jgi:hypothetical protein
MSAIKILFVVSFVAAAYSFPMEIESELPVSVEDIFEEKLGLYTCSKFYKINF